MKIVLNTETLKKALSEVNLVVPKKTPLQVLQFAKFTVSGGRMKIEANNQQAYIVKVIDILESDMEGGFLAKCEDLFSLVSRLNDPAITFIHDNDTLTIQYALGRAKVQTINASEFPIMEIENEDVTELTVPTAFLANSIKSARDFTATPDEMRDTLKPIYAFVDNGQFGYCATNTRLLIADTNADERIIGSATNWYIEQFIFSTLIKACEGNELATIRVSPKQVCYKIGDTLLITCQTQGRFPDYKRVIPQSYVYVCETEKSKLKDMLSRAALMLDDTKCVKIHIDDVNITISSDNLQIGKQMSETILHNSCNGEVTFGMNLYNMLICLEACNNNEISLLVNDPMRPIVFHDPTAPNKTILAMPMSI